MIWFKACPKCHGDLVESGDIYGKYVSCLQCGREMTAAPADAGVLSKSQTAVLEDPAELVAA